MGEAGRALVILVSGHILLIYAKENVFEKEYGTLQSTTLKAGNCIEIFFILKQNTCGLFWQKYFWSWQLWENLRRSSLPNMSGMQQWNMKYASNDGIKLRIFIGLSRKWHLQAELLQVDKTDWNCSISYKLFSFPILMLEIK